MSQVILTISGMSCGGCVNSVTRVLKAVPGVHEASVTLSPAQAVVRYDETLTDPQTLAQAVADAGFTVTGQQVSPA